MTPPRAPPANRTNRDHHQHGETTMTTDLRTALTRAEPMGELYRRLAEARRAS